MPGFYIDWELKHIHLEFSKFTLLDVFIREMSELQELARDFKGESLRERVQIFRSFKDTGGQLIGRGNRFPAGNYYVHWNDTTIDRARNHIYTRIELRQSINSRSVDTDLFSSTQSLTPYQGIIHFLQCLKSLPIRCYPEHGIYNRDTIETKYGLKWIEITNERYEIKYENGEYIISLKNINEQQKENKDACSFEQIIKPS